MIRVTTISIRHKAGLSKIISTKKNWKESILELYKTCEKFSIKSIIERSRSGTGGHLWVFFEDAFPAKQSRKIMFEILRQAGIISHFEKEPSFDRLFPNQDFHSGKGFGNLISLPLNGKSMEHGNTCFLNPDSFVTFEDQWAFLDSVEKVSVTKLKALYEELFNIVPENTLISSPSSSYGHDLEIIIQNQIFLKRNQLNKKLIAFLKEQLNFYNSDYLAKKNLEKSTFKTEKFFKLIEESEHEIILRKCSSKG